MWYGVVVEVALNEAKQKQFTLLFSAHRLPARESYHWAGAVFMVMKIEIGMKVAHWTVKSAGPPGYLTRRRWNCECDCENHTKALVYEDNLNGGKSTSCVKCRQKKAVAGTITHGLTLGSRGTKKPTEYKSWIAAKGRSFNPNDAARKDYMDRGITMCDGWANSYESFFADMGPKPRRTTINRLDNDGHYSCGHCDHCKRMGWPANCNWDTAKNQANNRRSNVRVQWRGREQTLAQWSDELHIPLKTLWDRLFRLGWDTDRAFTTTGRNNR